LLSILLLLLPWDGHVWGIAYAT